jgi:hypothetical protein
MGHERDGSAGPGPRSTRRQVLAAAAGGSVLVLGGASSARAQEATPVAKFAAFVGDGSSTDYVVEHNLGTGDVLVEVFRSDDGSSVIPDVTRLDEGRVRIRFDTAPASDEYRVVIVG